MSQKTIEDKYKKLSGREHILLRPGMYIGDVKKINEELWTINNTDKKMEKKIVEYSPGFLKIFDEVLTNATDHATRDQTVTIIKVDYNKNTGEISVYNNGAGIPVVIHKEQKIYVPELIFGHLLSGSNYNDNDKRTGSGTNGIGIKTCNIYSKKFIVETVDSDNQKKYIQEFSENMTEKTSPKITKNSTKSYTKITFLPDYPRFQMKSLEDDIILLINKRVYDCIACTNNTVQIYLNGEKLKGKGLQDYVKYFFNNEEKYKQFYETNEHKTLIWEYIIIPWEKYEHVSFVNGNSTYQGGKHVDCVVNQIVNKIKTQLETKKKLKDVKASMIKDKIFLFLRATVINPTFNSQTKECLTTQLKDFGCKIEVSDKFIEKIYKSSITSEIVDLCKLKETIALSKTTDGVKKNKIFVPKLEDANWAGTAKSNQCTLMLTEGDSAKTFCMWGRSVIKDGNNILGVMSLKGKILNVRDATIQQLINNEELNNIKKIVGLKQGKEYLNTDDLRYGKIMLVTDADNDGKHILSLFVNFIHAHYPSLIKLNFLQTLRTPIVKALKGKNILEFYTEQDYHKWENNTLNKNTYKIKYFKGLGTSQKDDAKELFKKLDNLKIDYYYKDIKCDESILLAFDKDKNKDKKKLKDTDSDDSTTVYMKCTDKRKEWLSTYDKNSYIDISEKRVSYQDLIHKELIHFSIYDNTRSIPILCDGLKTSQRKILYYMLKKNIVNPIKVAQLSGYVSAETGYHHGEVSLQQAIINMAQDFIGSNNINLLVPDGNFGSRLISSDAASPRYIYTYLQNITKIIFNEYDSFLLKEQYDDGIQIEPEWFIPIIPMILVNGCSGIGTGFSTNIPCFNPKDIINNILLLLDSKKPIDMIPYYKNFKGSIIELEPGSFISKGIYKKLNNTQIEITEIPIGSWVTNYKEFLESLIDGNDSKKSSVILKNVVNKTLDENTGINFLVEFKDSKALDTLINDGKLEKELKLIKPFSTNNMYLFDDKMLPSKYDNAIDILLDFYNIRLSFYEKRKLYIIKKLTDELVVLKNKLKFITEYIDDIIVINKQSKINIVKQLITRNYHKIEDSFNYLINMPIISMTSEKIDELEKQINIKEKLLNDITNKTNKDLWKEDLDILQKML